ncbi:Ig-like domain-containing protein [Anaerocolumna xylanovorans]|uniref:N-acetylmuramoyl-L-alanine amidase n=1 Tax=Anaerocolumna xylanovorans DSM 12503 TaxID=1121345 RepID=A0A1M7YHG6_9FIRM|nr:Ig-like domain-containing protein [Anaerocolumna xylanovorans]SHO52085.1 Ig-like domain (group 2) [Anaerocolumna xylanovorans DSM 12503]
MKNKKVISMLLTLCLIFYTITTSPYIVNAAAAKKITLNVKTFTLQVGESKSIKAAVTPSGSSGKVKWTSSNKKVAVVSSAGKVKAVAAGTALIKASLSNGKSASCKVTVKEKKVTVKSITLNKTKAEITLDDTLTLSALVVPANAGDRDISWSSSDEDVAFVDDEGTVFPMDEGTAIITAQTGNGVKSSCTVTVLANGEIQTSVTLDSTSITLGVGDEKHLNARIAPEDSEDDALFWDSSNEGVAQVDNDGNILATGAGTAEITVSLPNGKQAECLVTVKANLTPTPTVTPSPKATPTPTATPSPKATPTPTATPSPKVTPTPTAAPSPTPTPTPAPAASSSRISLPGQYYTLALKDNTGLVMDVTGAGQKNGTAVQVYSSNQTPAQQWYVENHDDGTVSLIAGCATTKVLDIMRTNNSTTGALKSGCKVDIYDHNDYPAQHFYIEQFGDGSCVLRLASNTGIVVQASSASQSAALVAGSYDVNNSLQRWYITPAVPAAVTEKEAYVYNTGGQGVFVRSSASTSANSIGGFKEGQKVTVIGDIQNGWYKVRGTDRNTGGTVEGYSHGDYITFNNPGSGADTGSVSFTIRTTAPASSDYHYYSNQNIYYASGWGMPNCTAYAWGRIWEIYGKQLPGGYFTHNACTWWSDNISSGKYKYGSEARVGAIAVWNTNLPYSDGAGHVAVVEKIENGTVYVSQSVYGGYTFKYSAIANTGYLLGYIYIDQPNY